ncbi:MAG: hypothetical protein J0H35_04665 [Rhodospirillales bacterium]|nr:hypothetical protein [Rhodospirillales bacterium]
MLLAGAERPPQHFYRDYASADQEHAYANASCFADFMDVLSRPAAPVPEMVELAKRPAPWEPGYVAKR